MIRKTGQSFKELKKEEELDKIAPKAKKEQIPQATAEAHGVKPSPFSGKAQSMKHKIKQQMREKYGDSTMSQVGGHVGRMPKVAKNDYAVSSGQSYNQLKKDELEKGVLKDLAVGASLAATMAAAGTAHQDRKDREAAAVAPTPVEMPQPAMVEDASHHDETVRRIASVKSALKDIKGKTEKK